MSTKRGSVDRFQTSLIQPMLNQARLFHCPAGMIFEERYRRKSTLITAQLPVAAWHEMIGEATLADAILDRIVHNAHRITLEGDSMRKRKEPTLLTGGEIKEINHP